MLVALFAHAKVARKHSAMKTSPAAVRPIDRLLTEAPSCLPRREGRRMRLEAVSEALI
jgi:hypothetical protein